MRTLGLLASVLLLCGCAARYKVEKVADLKRANEGVIYCLPRSVMVVELPIKQNSVQYSDLAMYAEMEMNMEMEGKSIKLPTVPPPKGLPKQPEIARKSDESEEQCKKRIAPLVRKVFDSWDVADSKITPTAEPDPDAMFLVAVEGDWTQNRTLNITLNEQGFLSDAMSHVEDRKLAIATTVFEAVLKVAGTPLTGAAFAPSPERIEEQPIKAEAKRLREILLSLRKVQGQLLSGTYDRKAYLTKDTLEIVLKGLHELERAIIKMFYPQTTTEYKFIFEVRPKEFSGNGPVTLVSIPADGERAQAAGDQPKYFKVNPNADPTVVCADYPSEYAGDDAQTKQEITLAACRDPNSVCSLAGPVEDSRPKGLFSAAIAKGFSYRIPGRVNMALELRGSPVKCLVRQTSVIPQAGMVAYLPQNTTSMDAMQHITLYENTGAFHTLGTETKAIDEDLIKRMGDATAGYLEKYYQYKAAEDQAKKPAIDVATEKMKSIQAFLDAARALGLNIPDLSVITAQ